MIGSYSAASWTEPVHSWIEPVHPVYSGAAAMAAAEQFGTMPQLQFLIGLKNKTDANGVHNVFRHELRLA